MKTYYIQDTLENELDYTNFVQRVGKDHIQLFKKRRRTRPSRSLLSLDL